MKKMIFYCAESQTLPDPYGCYLEIEEKLVSLFQENTPYRLSRIQKPEIYKHPLAFRFLEGFEPDSLHLIIRKPERIRLLKNARNVLILPEVITETKMTQTPATPFENVKRMVSLVDEIWTTRSENLDHLKGSTSSIEYFEDAMAIFDQITASV